MRWLAAFQAALAAFPNPQAFFNALVQAFGNIDVNLGLALQAALNVGVDGLQGFVDALVSGGATLAAAFNAALANFPSPGRPSWPRSSARWRRSTRPWAFWPMRSPRSRVS